MITVERWAFLSPSTAQSRAAITKRIVTSRKIDRTLRDSVTEGMQCVHVKCEAEVRQWIEGRQVNLGLQWPGVSDTAHS